MSMGKALKVIKQNPPARQEEQMELLVSHSRPAGSRPHTDMRARVQLHLILFIVGLFGSGMCLWAMLNTDRSEEVVQTLGFHRVANRMENSLELLAYPFLMLTVVLTLYAAQQLYRLYREANDPETYRRSRTRRGVS